MSRRITLVIESIDPDPDLSEGLLEFLENNIGYATTLGSGYRAQIVSVEAESWTQPKAQVTSEQIFG